MSILDVASYNGINWNRPMDGFIYDPSRPYNFISLMKNPANGDPYIRTFVRTNVDVDKFCINDSTTNAAGFIHISEMQSGIVLGKPGNQYLYKLGAHIRTNPAANYGLGTNITGQTAVYSIKRTKL